MIQGNAPEACRIIESLKKKYPNDKQIDLLQASFRKNAYTIYLCRLNFFSISERYKYLDDLIKLYPEKTQELEYVKKIHREYEGQKEILLKLYLMSHSKYKTKMALASTPKSKREYEIITGEKIPSLKQIMKLRNAEVDSALTIMDEMSKQYRNNPYIMGEIEINIGIILKYFPNHKKAISLKKKYFSIK